MDTLNSIDRDNPKYKSLSTIIENFKCENCTKEFLRGLFISYGSVTDPQKRYHLDFSFEQEDDSVIVSGILSNAGFYHGQTQRKGNHVLYIKDNDTISDFLAYIGAVKSAFDVMNTKIVKEVRNNANRLVNCDTANIEKAISASQKYIEAVEYIKSKGAFTALPGELREAAELRVTYIQASLNELAQKSQPPITKSGMKHRLEKLLSYSEELKKETQENK